MKVSDYYKKIYSLLDSVTPLSKDCGVLCGGACCKDSKTERKGMILFPYEERVLNTKGYETEQSEWKYGDKNAYILYCNGTCDRKFRPLACRIFPLTPIIGNDGSIKLIMNPLAKSICPLARSLKPGQLEPEFVQNVHKAINRISKLKGGKEFIHMLSDISKDFMKF